jgi:hypothetical protein
MGACIDRNKRILPEPRSVTVVHDSAPGKNQSQAVPIGNERFGLLLPMNKILRNGVPPRHVCEDFLIAIMLKKKMIFTFKVNHAVRVIHPVPFW